MFYTTIMSLSYVLMCSDTVHGRYSPFTTEKHLISHCDHRVQDNGQRGQRYDITRVNSNLRFNKATLTEANFCKLEKRIPNWFCVQCEIKSIEIFIYLFIYLSS
jgi:hypothetical protein